MSGTWPLAHLRHLTCDASSELEQCPLASFFRQQKLLRGIGAPDLYLDTISA